MIFYTVLKITDILPKSQAYKSKAVDTGAIFTYILTAHH
jgi:hypothetical protein